MIGTLLTILAVAVAAAFSKIVDPCDRDQLIAGSSCFGSNVLSARERNAAIVYYMATQAAECGAIADSELSTLLDAVACWQPLSRDQVHAIEVLVECESASDAGAITTCSLTEISTGIACLKNVDDETLNKMRVWLRCKLAGCISEAIIT